MNNALYSVEFDVFVAEVDEPIQISNMDIVTMRRKIAGFAVFRICFGWKNYSNPMFKLQQTTKFKNPFQNDIIDAWISRTYDKIIDEQTNTITYEKR